MRSKFASLISAITGFTAIAVVSLSSSVVQAAGPSSTVVALGESHAVSASTNGQVWTWGSLVPGPRGAGSRYSLQKPTEVVLPSSRDAVDVAATRQSSVALASDGTVWAWGYLGLGLGDTAATTSTDYLNPVQVSFGSTRISKVAGDCEGYIAIDENGEVWQWGSFWGVWSLSSSRPIKVAGVANAVAVGKSCSSAYAVLSDGTLKAWGSNGGGKLGDGTTSDRQTPVTVSIPSKAISSIAVSDSHVIARASDGTVWGWGSNSQSQLAVDPAAIQYSTTPRRITVTGASGSVVSVAATNGTPSSFAVMSTGEVWEWGSWSQTQFAPRQRTLPTTDLGSTKLLKLSVYYQNMLFVGSDNSIWAKGQYGQYGTSVDGNCGADAYEYPQWVNGRTIAPRHLVRVISNGQFGSAYNEDTLALRSLTTSSGTLLPLDGSGTAVGRQGVQFSVVATAPSSACYVPNQLTVTWDFDGDGTFETSGVASVNDGESAINTGTYTFNWSGRRRGGVRVANPDGVTQTYSFWMGVAAAAGSGGGGGSVSALPVAETSQRTSLALGTDGFIYGWGRETAALGTATVLPRRLFPGNSGTFTKLRFERGYRSTDYSIGGVMNSTGKVFVWGKTQSSFVFFNVSGQGVNLASSPYEIPFPNGVSRWLDFDLAMCGDRYEQNLGQFVLLIGDDQQLYVHGTGAELCTGSSNRVPTSPSIASGLTFSEFGPHGLLKGVDGWKSWNIRKIAASRNVSCWSYSSAGNCVSAPIEFFAPTSVTPSNGVVPGYSYGNYCYQGYTWSTLELSSAGQVELVVRSNVYDTNGCYEGRNNRGEIREVSRTNVSNWTTRTAVAIKSFGDSRSEPTWIIANDGTVWQWARWSQTPLRQIDLDPAMAVVKRFAGNSTYVVTSDSAVWTLPRADDYYVVSGTHLGSCAASRSNDSAAGARVYSTGQFGNQFAEDRFGFQIDAPSAIYNEQFPDQSYHARYNDWSGSPSLSVRPTSSAQLYGYVSSSCDGANVTRVEWDMDDNGTYEALGTVTSITTNATPITTKRIDRYGEVTYAGFDSTWKQVMTPSMDLSTPGGRYIGVKLTSAYGVQTKRFTVLVQPKKPSGYVGMTINSGARFTESSDVDLALTWPEGATTALISNDGGFTAAQEIPLSRTVRWKLPATGTGQLGTNVYVRYYNIYPDGNGSWSKDEMGYQVVDDIVLDLAAPTVSNVSASTSQALAAALRMDGIVKTANIEQFANVTVSAADAASGIAGMQVAADPAVPGPVRPYSSQVRVPVDRGRVAVRVQDNVGHWSTWTYARISGFVDSPEVPAPAPVTPAPVAPAPAPVTPAPVAPAPVLAPASPSQSAPVVAPAPSNGTTSAVGSATARAVLSGSTARVTVSVPASMAKTCSTKTVKGKKTTTCVTAQITVSVSGGATKKVNARSGNNSISMPKVKKGQTITVRVGTRVVSRIKVK
jgi:alpha-tubulin suppressor-like RCC1 family protein